MCRCTVRRFAMILQVIIYFCNAFAWAMAILALTCGFVIGIGNDTTRVSVLFVDLGISTPATILIIYGFLLIIVTTAGCFSSVTAGIIMSIIYVVLIILYILFDIFLGYIFLFVENALTTYYTNVQNSLSKYGESNAPGIGIFPVSPETFWNHLQSRGKCCGLLSYEDWRNTKYSKKHNFSIPDSCCSNDYSHRFCGDGVFRHPDSERHSINDLLHNHGCMEIFPVALRLPPDYRLTIVGICIAVALIICAVLTCVILVLVITKGFRADTGVNNIDYMETRKPSKVTVRGGADDSSVDVGGDGEQGPRGLSLRRTKVYPEEQRASFDEQNKRVLFRESGPMFIHDHYHSEPETSETNLRKFDQNQRKVVSQGNDRWIVSEEVQRNDKDVIPLEEIRLHHKAKKIKYIKEVSRQEMEEDV